MFSSVDMARDSFNKVLALARSPSLLRSTSLKEGTLKALLDITIYGNAEALIELMDYGHRPGFEQPLLNYLVRRLPTLTRFEPAVVEALRSWCVQNPESPYVGRLSRAIESLEITRSRDLRDEQIESKDQ